MFRAKCSLKTLSALKSFKRTYQSERVFGYIKQKQNHYVVQEEILKNRAENSNFFRLVTAYREHGHKIATQNPVAFKEPPFCPELDLKRYNLNESDQVSFKGIIEANQPSGSVSEALKILSEAYTGNISLESSHLESEEEREWICERLERLVGEELSNKSKIDLAKNLLKSETFDRFLAKKFGSLKRYGGEGAESMMGFFLEVFKLSAEDGIEELVLAMPHRGRLNLLTGLLNYPPALMFSKIRGNPDFPTKYKATGDVLSHLISSTDLHFGNRKIHVSMLYCPSHLEAVNPVSMGKTRAKQMDHKESGYGKDPDSRWSNKVLNLQVHGDAALNGQGVNQECASLSAVPHFEVGGSIHLVVNNQVGFTAPPERTRSSRYCTDLAKLTASPAIHLNGDDPEAVVKASRLAFEYQRKFRKDIYIDLNCYRQWGHNELDDPSFTNPLLYDKIKSRKTVPHNYVKMLKEQGIMSEAEADDIVSNYNKWLESQLNESESYIPEDNYYKNKWEDYRQADNTISTYITGVEKSHLSYLTTASVKCPDDFNIHPTILRGHVKNRLKKSIEGQNIDWSTAETLSIASLLYEGYNVRISGQDVGRGTFSQRHAMLVDQKTNTTHIPLNHMNEKQGFLEIANSILSEEAVLGYEYGMSVENPRNLIIWEAQFGDFFNGAQIIIDTCITGGETKWIWSSGIVMLLPHGFEGAGPEHSSARIERFLQLSDSKEDQVDGDDVNIQVCQPSTPAQYFHLLRRQMVRNFRKPLIVITPKILLRSSVCTSTFEDMAEETSFKPVIGDPEYQGGAIKRVLVTSGKHYYTLAEKRDLLKREDTAILRIESFSPFPTSELIKEMENYYNAKTIVWCQEEPQNMGAWSFVKPRFDNLVGKKIIYCGRKALAAPAVGVGKWHQQEVEEIVNKAFTVQVA